MFELTQSFKFDAAHTLERQIETESSRRMHGHSYEAEVTVAGKPDPVSGMVTDLGLLRQELSRVREQLDHRFLDEVVELRQLGPPTLETLCLFIARELVHTGTLSTVRVSRPSTGDSCLFRVPLPVIA
jgi:6-pyruvoyltetrahydropterin/6-carboxytetrahydropterin synthase